MDQVRGVCLQEKAMGRDPFDNFPLDGLVQGFCGNPEHAVWEKLGPGTQGDSSNETMSMDWMVDHFFSHSISIT